MNIYNIRRYFPRMAFSFAHIFKIQNPLAANGVGYFINLVPDMLKREAISGNPHAFQALAQGAFFGRRSDWCILAFERHKKNGQKHEQSSAFYLAGIWFLHKFASL